MPYTYPRNHWRSKQARKIEPTGWPGFSRDWYVHSSKSGKGGSPKTASATLQAVTDAIDALGTDGDNNGHVVHILPNHAETITGAGGLTFDVPGVRYIGYGVGNQRPRFLMDGGTSVTALITGEDVYLENLVFAGGHDGITTCFNITAGGATLKNIEFEDNTTAEHFLDAITASGAADLLTIEGCRWVSIDSGLSMFLQLSAIGVDRLTFTDNYYCADAATAISLINCAATAGAAATLTGCYVKGNTIVAGVTNSAALALIVDVHGTANTGVVCYNNAGHHDDAATITVDADGVRLFENRQVSTDTEQGLLDPILAGDT